MGQVEVFGYKSAWIAVKKTPPATLASALGIYDAQPSSWDCLNSVYNSPLDAKRCPVFITPPLDEWTLAVSDEFFNKEKVDLTTFICKLSDHLHTDVQFFSTHRVSETHTWMWARNKHLLRAYACEYDDVLLNEGPLTSQEQELGFRFTGFPLAEGENEEDLHIPDEEDVMRLAGTWSINPIELWQTHPEVPDGLLGSLVNSDPFSVSDFIANHRRKPWWKFW